MSDADKLKAVLVTIESAVTEMATLRAEVERLKFDLAREHGHTTAHTQRRAELESEIARLKAEKQSAAMEHLSALGEYQANFERANKAVVHSTEMESRAWKAEAQAAAMRRALEDANDKCRSAFQIASAYVTADRTAHETNWHAFRARLRESLERQSAAIASDAGKVEPECKDCDLIGHPGQWTFCRRHDPATPTGVKQQLVEISRAVSDHLASDAGRGYSKVECSECGKTAVDNVSFIVTCFECADQQAAELVDRVIEACAEIVDSEAISDRRTIVQKVASDRAISIAKHIRALDRSKLLEGK